MKAALDLAARQIGLNENDQKAALNDYLTTGGQNLDPAQTAWCAAFVDATLRQSGMEGTGSLSARSYLDWGQDVGDQPQPGDIAVFSRGDPNGPYGHVAFFEGYNDDGTIRVIGGNQSDSVSRNAYGADRLLGFRRGTPLGVADPASPAVQQAQGQPIAPAAPQNVLVQQQPPQPPQMQNALNVDDFLNRRPRQNYLSRGFA